MADNLESTTLVLSLPNNNTSNMINREYNHLLTSISQKVTKKLYGIAIFDILVGIFAIGLDIGLLVYDLFR
jgi:chromosomal replication initiation ATPase DnaA